MPVWVQNTLEFRNCSLEIGCVLKISLKNWKISQKNDNLFSLCSTTKSNNRLYTWCLSWMSRLIGTFHEGCLNMKKKNNKRSPTIPMNEKKFFSKLHIWKWKIDVQWWLWSDEYEWAKKKLFDCLWWLGEHAWYLWCSSLYNNKLQ